MPFEPEPIRESMSAAEAVAALDRLDAAFDDEDDRTSYPGSDHKDADAIVLGFLKGIAPEVAEAYRRCQLRAGDWWYE
jgi:hypothetical protein